MHRIIYRVVLLLAISAVLVACNMNDKKIEKTIEIIKKNINEKL